MDLLKFFTTLETLASGVHKLADAINAGAGSLPSSGTETPAPAPAPTTTEDTGKKRGRPAKAAEAAPAAAPAAPAGDVGALKDAIREALAADKATNGPKIRDFLLAAGAVDASGKPQVDKVPADKVATVTEQVKALLGLGGGDDDFGM